MMRSDIVTSVLLIVIFVTDDYFSSSLLVSVCVCVRIKEIERDGRLCDASKIIPLFGIGCDPHDDKSTKQYQGAIIVQG